MLKRPLRIAVASEGRTVSVRVDPRFGRAPFIVICDTQKADVEVIDNLATSQQAGGAGVKAAETVVGRHVDYVVSQNFGPKALQVFRATSVKAAVLSEGTVADAVELVQRGQLHII